MKVILDVNRPSSISLGVQYCSSVEGFMEIKKSHPEDQFEIDLDSYEFYQDYMEKKVMQEVQAFCDENSISLEMFSAMIEWNSVKAKVTEAECEFEYLLDRYHFLVSIEGAVSIDQLPILRRELSAIANNLWKFTDFMV